MIKLVCKTDRSALYVQVDAIIAIREIVGGCIIWFGSAFVEVSHTPQQVLDAMKKVKPIDTKKSLFEEVFG